MCIRYRSYVCTVDRGTKHLLYSCKEHFFNEDMFTLYLYLVPPIDSEVYRSMLELFLGCQVMWVKPSLLFSELFPQHFSPTEGWCAYWVTSCGQKNETSMSTPKKSSSSLVFSKSSTSFVVKQNPFALVESFLNREEKVKAISSLLLWRRGICREICITYSEFQKGSITLSSWFNIFTNLQHFCFCLLN